MKDFMYIANVRMPTEKGHGLQIAKMCESFTNQGVSYELVIPTRKNPITQSVKEYYELSRDIPIHKLSVIDTVGVVNRYGFIFESIQFAYKVDRYLRKQGYTGPVLSRDPYIFWKLIQKGYKGKLFYEVHTHNVPKNNERYASILKSCYFITTNQTLKDTLLGFGVSEERITVIPNGFDPDVFSPPTKSKKEYRGALNIKEDQKVVVYTGHLYPWKGIDTVLDTARHLPDVRFLLIGGTKQDIESLSKDITDRKLMNIMLLGHKPYTKLAHYIHAADVAILPLTERDDASKLFTSPIKLFGYYACGTPVVASNVPALKGLAEQELCTLVDPDNAGALASGIKHVFSDSEVANYKAKRALDFVQEYTWDMRAEKIKKLTINYED